VSELGADAVSSPSAPPAAAGAGIRLKSVREPASPDDGRRILVNRFWPPGVRRASARLSEWRPDWAPSQPLRQWFDYSEERWPAFRARYRDELESRGKLADIRELGRRARRERITLVYTGASPERNVAAALIEFVQGV
jgi:uncharacterized protein YeaO (DUF488 family)